MTTFHILTIFPEILDSYLNESILKRAQEKKLVKFKIVNIRDFTLDKHRRTDYKPYSGGPGLVFFAQPILSAVQKIQLRITNYELRMKKKAKTKIIILSPGGKQFDNPLAIKYAKTYTDIILICGRYEGIDVRVKKILKAEEISVGPYVLTGGELPAMIIADSVSRQIKGVLGNEDSPEERRISSHEVYTRPEVLIWKGKKYKVPKVLLSGNHKDIEDWKLKQKKN
jgi:tRNA (guanine37-N1)-methyltransferase